MSSEERRRERSKALAEGTLTATTKAIDMALVDGLPKDVAKATRFVVKRAVRGPEQVYTIAKVGSAADRGRVGAGALGGLVGGRLGTIAGAATGPLAPVAVPVGTALGSYVGEKAGEFVYDNKDEMAEAIRKGAGTAKQWMAARSAQLMAPYWPVDDYHRARGR